MTGRETETLSLAEIRKRLDRLDGVEQEAPEDGDPGDENDSKGEGNGSVEV